MNYTTLIFGLLLFQGFIYANQDIEEDLIELMSDMRLRKQPENVQQQKKTSQTSIQKSTEQPQQTIPYVQKLAIQPPQDKKKLDYKELYDNFELYESKQNLDEYRVDKQLLLNEAIEEIAAFDKLEQEKFGAVKKFGALTIGFLLLACAPWVPHEIFSEIDGYVKVGITTVACAGAAGWGYITNEKTSAWRKQKEDSLKKRHEAIKDWLHSVN